MRERGSVYRTSMPSLPLENMEQQQAIDKALPSPVVLTEEAGKSRRSTALRITCIIVALTMAFSIQSMIASHLIVRLLTSAAISDADHPKVESTTQEGNHASDNQLSRSQESISLPSETEQLSYQYGGKERVELALDRLPPWVRDYVQCKWIFYKMGFCNIVFQI